MENKEKINELRENLKKINEKIKDSTDTAILSGMYAKDEVDKKIKEAKVKLSDAQEKLKEKSEKGKIKLTEDITKMQDSLQYLIFILYI